MERGRQDMGAPGLGTLLRRSSVGERHLRVVGALEAPELEVEGDPGDTGEAMVSGNPRAMSLGGQGQRVPGNILCSGQ